MEYFYRRISLHCICRNKRPGRLIFRSNKKIPIFTKTHRFCVLPPLKNHCFWWAFISANTVCMYLLFVLQHGNIFGLYMMVLFALMFGYMMQWVKLPPLLGKSSVLIPSTPFFLVVFSYTARFFAKGQLSNRSLLSSIKISHFPLGGQGSDVACIIRCVKGNDQLGQVPTSHLIRLLQLAGERVLAFRDIHLVQ